MRFKWCSNVSSVRTLMRANAFEASCSSGDAAARSVTARRIEVTKHQRLPPFSTGWWLAAVDRLVHHATIFEMNVESYRRREAMERKRGPGRPASYATPANSVAD